MPAAYNYTRFSSEQQRDNDSLRRQSDLAKKYVDKHKHLNLVLDTSMNLSDPAMSAYKGVHASRGALAAFLRAVEDGQIEVGSYLLIESLDRLSRESPEQALTRVLDLSRAGIVVVTLNDEKEYSKSTLNGLDGTFVIMQSLVSMARAHEESLTKSRRVSAAWSQKFKAIADGKALTKRTPFWLSADRTIKQEEANVVRRIFELRAQGIGSTRIVKLLNQEGVPSPTEGKPWQQSSVNKLIASTNPIGNLVTKDGQEHKGYYPPVVSEELWLAAKRVSASAGRVKADLAAPKPFAGLLRCRCGSPMRSQSRTGRLKADGTRSRWDYAICSTANKGAGCVFKGIPYKDIIRAVEGEIVEIRDRMLAVDAIGQDAQNLELTLEQVEEEIKDAYQEYRRLKSSALRDRYEQMVAEGKDIEAELKKIRSSIGAVALNVVERLFKEPKLTNVWWRQVLEQIEVDTIQESLTIKPIGCQGFSVPLAFELLQDECL